MKILSKLSAILFSILFLSFSSSSTLAEDITNPWTTTTSLPYQLASHVSFGHDGKVYVLDGSAVTGNSHNEVISSTVSLNGSLSTWSTTSIFPTALIWHSIARRGDNIHILGGREENSGSALDYVKKTFVGNINNLNTWTPTTPLPNNLSQGGAVTVGDWIYFMGGRNSSGIKQEVYYAPLNPDGTIGNWDTSSVSLPNPTFAFGIVSYDNHIVIVGGVTGSVTNKVYITTVNPADGSISPWTEIASLPGPQNGQNHTVLIGNKIIVVGGGDNSGPLDKIYYTEINPDGTVQPWEESANHLPLPIAGSAVSYTNGYLYLTGGFSGGYKSVVYVSKLNLEPDLAVPLFKQNNPLWGAQTYNFANLWSPAKTGIDRWGCAMTSAAMVFNYHNITKLPDGQILDPGTLNTWLKIQSDGYIGEGLVNWNALSRLSKVAKSQNPAFSYDALENSRVNGFAETQLKEDLENNIPGILEVPNHFVVGKGTSGGSVLIHDPFYSRVNLSDYGNTFKSLRRFVPSNTDLSSVLLVVPEGITLGVKDESGNIVGEGYLQDPIHDDVGGGVNPKAFYVYEVQKPELGNYIIKVSSDTTKQYELKQYAYDENGNVKILTSQGILEAGGVDTFNLSYNKGNVASSKVVEAATFTSFLADLDLLYAQGKIKNLGIYITLKTNTRLAQMFNGMGIKAAAKAHLNTVMTMLDSQRKKNITEDAYQILKPQVQLLLFSI